MFKPSAYRFGKTVMNHILKYITVISRTTGVFKAVTDAKTNEILRVRLLGEAAHEIINIITVAMNAHFPYTSLRDQINTHPTLAEGLNDLFAMVD